jgi:hypothetical protein
MHDVLRLAQFVVGIVVLKLLLPKGMDQVALQIIRGMLQERVLAALFPDLGISLAQLVQTLLLCCLDDQRVDIDGPVRESAKAGEHCLRGSYFLVPGSSDTIVKVQLMSTSSSLTFSPFSGAFATCIVISKLLLPVAYVTRPDSWRSHISVSGEWMVMRSQLAVTVVTSSPVCLSVAKFRHIQLFRVAV